MKYVSTLVITLALTLLYAREVAADVPVQTPATPTIHGGTPMKGLALAGEIGYAALRGSLYTGDGNRDVGVQLSAPTFGHDTLPGWGQSLGIDIRAPFRFLVARWERANGSFKVGPYFHAGRACYRRGWRGYRFDGPGPHPRAPGPDPDWDYDRHCGVRSVGLGANLGFVTDIALPKLFKLIIGIEQQLGMINYKNRDIDYSSTNFAGATWIDAGLEAYWRQMIFTMIINAGAQYGSNQLYYRDHALFRQMFGFGYHFG